MLTVGAEANFKSLDYFVVSFSKVNLFSMHYVKPCILSQFLCDCFVRYIRSFR